MCTECVFSVCIIQDVDVFQLVDVIGNLFVGRIFFPIFWLMKRVNLKIRQGVTYVGEVALAMEYISDGKQRLYHGQVDSLCFLYTSYSSLA